MVKHKPTQTRKSQGPGSQVAGAEPVEARPVATRQMQAVTQNVGAHLKPLTRSWERSWIPIIRTQPSLRLILFPLLPLGPWITLFISGQTHFHYVFALRHADKFNRARHVSMKPKQSGISYEIHSQLTHRVRVNKMLSGCFCLRYGVVLCSIIFKLK